MKNLDIKTIIGVIPDIVKSMNDLSLWGLFSIVIILVFICIITWILTHPIKTNVVKYIRAKEKIFSKRQKAKGVSGKRWQGKF